MKILVIGCNGQLGTDLMSVCAEQGHAVSGIDFPVIDITDAARTRDAIIGVRPEVIINSAAYTAVDDAEKNEARAHAINADGVANIAHAALEIDAHVVHISTDYVFDGTKTSAYFESDTPNPLTAYGRTKRAGEVALAAITRKHQTFRIAWLYGVHGANFVKTILKAAKQNASAGKPLKVVNDQFGTPTHTVDVCNQIMRLLPVREYGTFHATSEGVCTWFDFAKLIVEKAGIKVEVLPCTTAEYPRPAPRPAYSALENARFKQLGINIMPPWQDAYDHFWKLYQPIYEQESK